MKYTVKNVGGSRLSVELLSNLTYQINIGNRFDKTSFNIERQKRMVKNMEETFLNFRFLESITKEYINIFGEKVKLSEIEGDIGEYRKKRLYDEAIPLLNKYSKILGIPYKSLSIIKSKRYHGFCTYDQHICLNIDLLHYSKECFEYVIIHEVCHLQEKHHRKSFRSLVESFCPNYKSIINYRKNIVVLDKGLNLNHLKNFKDNITSKLKSISGFFIDLHLCELVKEYKNSSIYLFNKYFPGIEFK